MENFKVFRLREADRKVSAAFETASIDDLDPGSVVIKVAYSGVNYKDALAATGKGRIIRRFPCIGGIDLSGTVVESSDGRFRKGDAVIATSYDIGVAHDGGYAEYARIPADWVVPMPQGLSLFEAMALGTAGFTAGLAVVRMEHEGLKPGTGPVAVTGATGGVGSIAVDILAGLGHDVTAITGKEAETGYLKGLGAKEVMLRSGIDLAKFKPLEKATWAGAVDNLGGEMLAWLAATMQIGAPLASVGLAASMSLPTTVAPFILRGVSLLGIDSVNCPMAQRREVWHRLATDMRPKHLAQLTKTIPFDALPRAFDDFVEARVKGPHRRRHESVAVPSGRRRPPANHIVTPGSELQGGVACPATSIARSTRARSTIPTVSGASRRPPSTGTGRSTGCWTTAGRRSRAGSSAARRTCATTPSTGTWRRAPTRKRSCTSSTETNETRTYTYRELHAEVNRFAAMMRDVGVGKGDRVLIYMPMIAEAAFAILACARIGAIHSVVFGGFASGSLATRIDDARPKLIVSADAGMRGGKAVPYKHLLDEAIKLAQSKPEKVILVNRGLDPDMSRVAERDLDYAELRARHMDAMVPVTWMESNEPSYILYTSGTTGKPKGVQRDVGGYAVALAASMKHVYCGTRARRCSRPPTSAGWWGTRTSSTAR